MSPKKRRLLTYVRAHPGETAITIATDNGYINQPNVNPDLVELVNEGLLTRSSKPYKYYCTAKEQFSIKAADHAIPNNIERTQRRIIPSKENSITLDSEIEKAVRDFLHVAALAGAKITNDQISIKSIEAEHKPSALENGKMGIYAFRFKGVFLKIGKAGPKSKARFSSQHYGLNAPSTLAKSLLADRDFLELKITEINVNQWMLKNLDRIEIQIDARLSMHILALLEVFLHCRFRPKYEGKAVQTEE